MYWATFVVSAKKSNAALRGEKAWLPEKLPGHVAIIMDGNGRWAERRGLARIEGHRQGARSVSRITRSCRKLGIRALTLYAFSEQNWFRPVGEVEALMHLLAEYIERERDEILDNGIRLSTVGRVHRLPEMVREPLLDLIDASSSNDRMDLCLALSYGGREEIVDAARNMASAVREGTLDPSRVDEDIMAGYLWTAHLPPVDLIIRTSGELRLSNFMLWHAAYAELYFTETLWPDFGEPDLLAALEDYSRRQRRFGRVGETIPADPEGLP